LNGQEVKVVKVKGVFPWHVHEKEDEMFMVWKGCFRVEFKEPNGYTHLFSPPYLSSLLSPLSLPNITAKRNQSGKIRTRRDGSRATWQGTQVSFIVMTPSLFILTAFSLFRTGADEEAEVLIFEPAETLNTGNVVDATYTALPITCISNLLNF
jgi:hypothetical protein